MAPVVPLPVGAARRLRQDARSGKAHEDTDQELVQRGRAGDSRALEVLFRRHLPGLRAFAFRLLPQDPELDDVIQEAFAVALADLRKLEDPAAFGWWLRGVLINLVRGRLRRRRLLRALGLWAPHDTLDTSFVSASAPPDVAAELRRIYAVVARLDPDTRTTLILHRVEELTLHEVASVLQVSYSTAKRLLARAEHELAIELGRSRRDPP